MIFPPDSLIGYRDVDRLISDYQSGTRPRLIWSNHALRRFNEMKQQAALTAAEVAEAVVAPARISRTHKYDAMLLTHTRVTVSVCIGIDGLPVIATLLWATADDWLDSYGARPADGRTPRTDLTHLPRRENG